MEKEEKRKKKKKKEKNLSKGQSRSKKDTNTNNIKQNKTFKISYIVTGTVNKMVNMDRILPPFDKGAKSP